MSKKTCSICGEKKPEEDFHPSKGQCQPCVLDYQQARRDGRVDEFLEQNLSVEEKPDDWTWKRWTRHLHKHNYITWHEIIPLLAASDEYTTQEAREYVMKRWAGSPPSTRRANRHQRELQKEDYE